MQLQRTADGSRYREIKEVLTKSPLQDWLQEQEEGLIARAWPGIDNAVYNDDQCSDDCQDDCSLCPRWKLYAMDAILGWETRN